jgi:hypothetical protein
MVKCCHYCKTGPAGRLTSMPFCLPMANSASCSTFTLQETKNLSDQNKQSSGQVTEVPIPAFTIIFTPVFFFCQEYRFI